MVIIANIATDDTLALTEVAVLVQIIVQTNLLKACSSLNSLKIPALCKVLQLKCTNIPHFYELTLSLLTACPLSLGTPTSLLLASCT